jgi:hypothetical protein
VGPWEVLAARAHPPCHGAVGGQLAVCDDAEETTATPVQQAGWLNAAHLSGPYSRFLMVHGAWCMVHGACP